MWFWKRTAKRTGNRNQTGTVHLHEPNRWETEPFGLRTANTNQLQTEPNRKRHDLHEAQTRRTGEFPFSRLHRLSVTPAEHLPRNSCQLREVTTVRFPESQRAVAQMSCFLHAAETSNSFLDFFRNLHLLFGSLQKSKT